MAKQPTMQEKKAVFHNSLWYEILYTFGVPRHDPTDYSHWEFINFTRMGHGRAFCTIFSKLLRRTDARTMSWRRTSAFLRPGSISPKMIGRD